MLAFEGCMSDIYINEKFHSLREDLLSQNNTQPGCPVKLDECKTKSDTMRSQCTKCSHVWSRVTRCECRQGDDYEFLSDELYCVMRKADQVFTLADNGYLSLNDKQANSDVKIELGVKMRAPGANSTESTLIHMRFVNLGSEYLMRLIYDWQTNEMRVMGGGEVMIRMRKNRILDDEFWTKIQIELKKNGQLKLTVNGLFDAEVVSKQIESLFGQKYNLRTSIHGPGCVRGVKVNGDPSFGFRAVNSFKG